MIAEDAITHHSIIELTKRLTEFRTLNYNFTRKEIAQVFVYSKHDHFD